jgi:SHS2 domain-containing protein
MAKSWIAARIDKLELAKVDEQLVLHLVATGQLLDLKKHELQVEVKAVTFHQMEIKQSGNNFFTRLVFDV